jgi:putative cardiolipin synthase
MQKAPHRPLTLSHTLRRTDRPLRNRSAFYPLDRPDDALAARLYLIDHAVNTLDVQYYIYEDDTVGKLVSAHLLKAAQRGVRVRILLDDISTTGKDRALAALASHPNISLRFFNPNPLRRFLRNFALLLRIDRLGKRMHNKALIADNYAAIVGGRNIGDVYFANDEGALFLDYDILAVGNVVGQITRSFQIYYESELSKEASEVIGKSSSHLTHRNLETFIRDFNASRLGKAVRNAPFTKALRNGTLRFVVAEKTYLYYDDPRKVTTDETDRRYHIAVQVDRTLKKVRKELIIISPYFIPDNAFLNTLARLHTKGVRIVAITNSLASTDVFPVYSGYKHYIKALLERGTELYELKPDSLHTLLRTIKFDKPLRASLHTKMLLIDDDRLVVGSANLDPRSDKLNTELVLVIVSRKLNAMHKRKIKAQLHLRYFYKIGWGKRPFKQNGTYWEGPVWITEKNNQIVRYYLPPHSGFFKQMATDLIGLLPIEGYL